MTHEISCKQLVDLVADYLDESITDEWRGKFEQHLSECGYCAAYVQQMKVTITLTNQLVESRIEQPIRDELLGIFRKWKRDQQ